MDSRLDEEARTCAVIARSYGLITFSLMSFWEAIKPIRLGMESSGRSLNCWHHTDYGEQYKLHYFWDQLIKRLAYLALANSWGELNGRPRQPAYPPPSGSVPAALLQAAPIVEQTTQVVDPPAVTIEEMVTIAKAEEEVAILEEPGIVNDIDLATIVYTVPEVGEEPTPTMEIHEAVKSDTRAVYGRSG